MPDLQNTDTIEKWLGMRSDLEADKIPNGYLANALNIDCSSIGSISPAKGYSSYGSQLEAAGKIISMPKKAYRLDDGTEVALRVRDNNTNTILEWLNKQKTSNHEDGEWETLVAGLTTGKEMSFAPYNYDDNGTLKNRLYFCNGIENLSFWNGATTYLTVATSGGEATITVNSTSNFDNSGSLVIGGTTVTYTGKTSTTFTGCSSTPAASINDGVAQLPDTTTQSGDPKLEMMVVTDGRIWGVDAASRTILQYCERADPTDWTPTAPPDEPGVVDLPEGDGPITGLGAIREWVIVFKRDRVIAIKLEFPSATTKALRIEVVRQGDDVGVETHDAVISTLDSVYYATPKGGIKGIAVSNEGKLIPDDLTDIVYPSLRNAVFSNASAIYWEKEKKLLVSYKKDSNSTQNDTQIKIEFAKDENLNTVRTISFQDWQVECWQKYDGKLIFGGSYIPNCYHAFDGYTKDEGAFNSIATTKRYHFGVPMKEKTIFYLPIEGYIGPGQRLQFQLDYDTQGTRYHGEADFDSATETQYIIEPQLNTIGAFELGTEPIGGTLAEVNELNFFRMYLTLPTDHHPYDVQLTIHGDGVNKNGEIIGNRWKITRFGWDVVSAKTNIDSRLKKFFKLT